MGGVCAQGKMVSPFGSIGRAEKGEQEVKPEPHYWSPGPRGGLHWARFSGTFPSIFPILGVYRYGLGIVFQESKPAQLVGGPVVGAIWGKGWNPSEPFLESSDPFSDPFLLAFAGPCV